MNGAARGGGSRPAPRVRAVRSCSNTLPYPTPGLCLQDWLPPLVRCKHRSNQESACNPLFAHGKHPGKCAAGRQKADRSKNAPLPACTNLPDGRSFPPERQVVFERQGASISNAIAAQKRHMTSDNLPLDSIERHGLPELELNPRSREQPPVGFDQRSGRPELRPRS